MTSIIKEGKNRITEELTRLAGKESRMAMFKGNAAAEKIIQKDKLKFYNELLFRFNNSRLPLNEEEKMSLRIVRTLRNKTDRTLNGRVIAWIKRRFRPVFQALLKTPAPVAMDRDINRLDGELSKMGLWGASQLLRQHISFGLDTFSIPIATVNNGKDIRFQLNYRPDQSGKIALDNINLEVCSKTDPKLMKRQMFSADVVNRLTIGQMINLTEGRPVCIRIADDNKGIMLKPDVNDKTTQGYLRIREYQVDDVAKLKKEISSLPHSPKINNRQLEEVMNNLFNGDQVALQLKHNWQTQKFRVEIGPDLDSFKVTDGTNNHVNLKDSKGPTASLQAAPVKDQVTKRQAIRKQRNYSM